jgi:hypothetical protein
MQHLVDAVRRSVRDENWYAALTGVLALPDIAGKLDGKETGSQARFVRWFNEYLLPTYTHLMGDDHPHVFLSGRDCYALRCAYLHEGEFDITDQRAREALEQFHFVVARSVTKFHCNQVLTNLLYLQVDCFCEEVCGAVEAWLRSRQSDPDVAAALAGLPLIEFM